MIVCTHAVEAVSEEGRRLVLGRFPSDLEASSFAGMVAASKAWVDVRVREVAPLEAAIAAEVDRCLGAA